MIIIEPDVAILKISNDKKMFISVLHENIYISEALGPIMGVVFSLCNQGIQGQLGPGSDRSALV